ncbi:MAG: DUF3084 domain-containing protein [Candidatus Muiribacteriaceae bacterium]
MKIFGIMLFSGLIAYIGDMVGFRMGKKKISLLGLRPRQTATLITIAFGVIITLITILFLSIISEDVKTALFQMEDIRAQIAKAQERIGSLQKEREKSLQNIKDLNDDIIDKKKEIEQLKTFYSELRRSVIVIEVNEVISHVIIDQNTPYDQVVIKFRELFRESYKSIRKSGIQTNPIDETLENYEDLINEKAKIIADSPVRFLLQTKASSNLTLKSSPGNVFDIVAIAETKIINAGESVESPFFIDSSWDMKAIYNTVTLFFDQVEDYLESKNALLFGDYFVHPLEMYDICREIKETDQRIYMNVIFTRNIYPLGPFSFRIEFINADDDDKKNDENNKEAIADND